MRSSTNSMDLYSGLPYWIAKNRLYNLYQPLSGNRTTDVAVIGGGITGALVAHQLCKKGIKCIVVDKRSITTGSSTASTALLQYEIDTPMTKLAKMYGAEKAYLAYHSCLESISALEEVCRESGITAGFERVPSIFYASNYRGLQLIKKEYSLRKSYHLPVRFLNRTDLLNAYGIRAPGALVNNASAQIDPYAAATGLIDHHFRKKELEVFTHTPVTSCIPSGDGYTVETGKGYRIHCQYVVIAAGYESGQFLPEPVMKLTSTYAIISQPVNPEQLWPERALIWETRDPYLYIRTSNHNRIIVGGEDEEFRDPVRRDKLLRKKVAILEKKIKRLFPGIPFVTDMAWCGTFSSTKDGLPFIGNRPGNAHMLYALGYGGNGITFSMIAAQLLANKIGGIPDKRETIFGFERDKSIKY